MKKLTKIVAAGLLASLALSGAAVAADTPSTHQDFEAKVFAGAKPGKTPKKGSIGSYLRPFHSDTWPAEGSKPTSSPAANQGALNVTPPFATAYAYIYLDKNVTWNTDSFPGCSEATMLTLAPENNYGTCPKGSILGKGEAAGFVRGFGSAPGVFVTTSELDTRVIASGEKNKFYLFTYNQLTKANIIKAEVSKASGKWGQRIKFILPRGLILPIPGNLAQLSSFDATIPAQSAKGKNLLTLKKCPSNKKLSIGFQNFYTNNATAKAGVNPTDGDDFVISSNSPVITRTGKCK